MSVLDGKRNEGFSYIRVIACIAIVFIHSYFLGANYLEVNSVPYLTVMAIRNLFLWSVPCFVMVSGALLLDPNRKMTYKKLFSKYIPKVAIALVAFTIINTVYSGIADHVAPLDTFKNIWISLFTGNGWPHMWYLYLLLALYLTLPVFRIFVKNTDTKTYNYILIVMTVVLSIIPGILTLCGLGSGFYLLLNTIYPLFFLLGHYLMTREIRIRKSALAGIFIVCEILTISLTFAGKSPALSNYSFPVNVLSSVAFFMLLKDAHLPATTNNMVARIIDSIDRSTFGIYLVHLIVLRTMFIIFNPFSLPFIIGAFIVFVYTIASFIISWGLTLGYNVVLKLIKKN